MNEVANPVINPIYWSATEIVSYGHDTIHELPLNAAGTINSYHLVLGRCLLAVQRSKMFELFGCSGAVHYATQVLGLRAKQARTLRWVAEKLEALPLLSRAGELGQVSWSVLREVVRKATPDTEEYWLALCQNKRYHEMAKIVRHTPDGGLPGDLAAEGDKEPALSELRIHLGITAKTVVERGLQTYSLAQGRPVTLAEAIEGLFAKLVQKENASDLDALSKSQQEARKDLWADHCRREPLLREARELAQSMGLAGFDSKESLSDLTPSIEEIAGDLLESIAAETPLPVEFHQCPARDISNEQELNIKRSPCPARVMATEDESDIEALPLDDGTIEWEELLKAHQVSNPEDTDVILLANDWRNRRLRENGDARLPTHVQKRELLRRDGYCCSTPGCPNHLWIESHHIVFYSRKGKTISANLTNICGSCHKNVHRGHLRIGGQAPDQLVFTDRHGRDLRRSHELNVAGWINFWLGWEGGPEDSHIVTFTVINTAGLGIRPVWIVHRKSSRRTSAVAGWRASLALQRDGAVSRRTPRPRRSGRPSMTPWWPSSGTTLRSRVF